MTGLTCVDALTMQGRIVHVRPVRPGDELAIRDLHVRVSPRSRYLRFFSAAASPELEVLRLMRPQDARHLALVVEGAGQIVGLASYERISETAASVSVLVDDARQGEGIGTLVLEHLAAAARRAGIEELVGEVLAGNGAMLRMAGDLAPGATLTIGEDLDTTLVRAPTLPDEASLAAVDARERIAEQRSLRPLLAPASVVVVGAERRPGGIGHEVLAALVAGGYTGEIYPVNPCADEIVGLPAYPSLASIGAPVDLAVVAVPATNMLDVVSDCARAGVGAAVVLTAGPGGSGVEGACRRADLVPVARAHGLRLVGPNSLVGVLNTDPALRLTTMLAPSLPPAGGLAVASQSGAVGMAILDAAARTGTGISTFVSLGNEADVSSNDLLAYWYDDPATRAVALYLESFGNPRRFARVARALARRKPVLAVKSGRRVGQQRVRDSHSGAARDTAVDSLFAQAGVIRTDTLGELLDAARVLVNQPLPKGNRLAVVGNAGGLSALAADAAEPAGLTVPELSAPVRAALTAATPSAAAVGNPIDLGAEGTPAAITAAVRALATSGEVDAVVATFVSTHTNDVVGMLAAFTAAADDAPDLPVAAVVVGATDAPAVLGARHVPVFPLPEEAVRALGRAARYATRRREPVGERPRLSGVDSQRARSIVAEVLAAGRGGWQSQDVARSLLLCFGVPVIETWIAANIDEALSAADRLGYPVAVKAVAPDLVHMRDVGAAWLDLTDPEAVRCAYAVIGVKTPDVAVQRMVPPGVELVAGVLHDRQFGSLVMLSLGGVHTDLLDDNTFRLLPVTTFDARQMWRSLRGAPLLTGDRGGPPVDTEALEDLLLRVGRLAEELPEVAELDLNPVLAGSDGAFAVDVALRLSTVEDEPDPYVRSLS